MILPWENEVRGFFFFLSLSLFEDVIMDWILETCLMV